jgi:hypothetical protein
MAIPVIFGYAMEIYRLDPQFVSATIVIYSAVSVDISAILALIARKHMLSKTCRRHSSVPAEISLESSHVRIPNRQGYF